MEAILPETPFFPDPKASPPRTIVLSHPDGPKLELSALGARLTRLWAPDRAGTQADIVLGQDKPEAFLTVGRYMGATCGRFANRIAGGRFTLDGVPHQLDRNEGPTHLHGGSAGFDSLVWDIANASATEVTFTLSSADGDMGYPGQLKAACTYRLLGTGRLLIEMTATTTAPTIVNLAHHSYFNLAGHDAGSVLDHVLRVDAASCLLVDGANIPAGVPSPVAGTAFDFTRPRPIGKIMPGPGGFDHCFCLDRPLEQIAGHEVRRCAMLQDPQSGRALRVWTNAPGLQVYTGTHFNATPGKDGARYQRFAGVALETQGYPDAPNRPDFPSVRLDPGETYRHLMLLDVSPD